METLFLWLGSGVFPRVLHRVSTELSGNLHGHLSEVAKVL